MNQQQIDIREVNRRITMTKDELKWRPIETAPKDGGDVVVWIPGEHRHSNVDVMRWVGRSGNTTYNRFVFSRGGSMYATKQPTHWMPLPEPPK